MDYSPEAFDALVNEVESQGGAMLPDSCEQKDIVYTKKDGYKHPSIQERVTCGCGNESRLVSVYNHGLEGDDVPESAGFATLCAVCDSVGAQPRYIEAVIAADPDMDPIERDEDDDDEDDYDNA